MTKRLFVAVLLSPYLRASLREWQQSHQSLPVRWLPEENWHVTIVPPWQGGDLSRAIEVLQSFPLSVKPFNLRFERIHLGPNKQAPRMIWLSGKTPPELITLRDQLQHNLELPVVDRPLRLHVTVARFRPEDYANFPESSLDDKVNFEETANGFALMESHLSPQGAKYEIIQQFLL